MTDLKFKYDIHFQKFGKTWVGITLDQDKLPLQEAFCLNDTGHFIALMLMEGSSREEIVRKVLDEYDIDNASVTAFVDELITSFCEMKLL